MIANPQGDATGVRYRDLPLSPPKVLSGLDQAAAAGDPGAA